MSDHDDQPQTCAALRATPALFLDDETVRFLFGVKKYQKPRTWSSTHNADDLWEKARSPEFRGYGIVLIQRRNTGLEFDTLRERALIAKSSA